MAAVKRTLSIEVRDSLFDPDCTDRVALFRRRPSGDTLYRVFIYLEGPDLPFVNEVTYRLHETFSPPTRAITRSVSNSRCKITIWTWGIFTVRATIGDKTEGQITITHDLTYGQQISAPETVLKAG